MMQYPARLTPSVKLKQYLSEKIMLMILLSYLIAVHLKVLNKLVSLMRWFPFCFLKTEKPLTFQKDIGVKQLPLSISVGLLAGKLDPAIEFLAKILTNVDFLLVLTNQIGQWWCYSFLPFRNDDDFQWFSMIFNDLQ